jgi:PKHD-type hydroxylase
MSKKNKILSASLGPDELDRRRAEELGGTFVTTLPPCFTEEQIEQLKSVVDAGSQQGALAGSLHGVKLEDVRRSEIRWLDYKEYKWVYDIAWAVAKKVNEKYRFEIKPIREMIQLSIYDESVQGFYSWHTDATIYNMSRKISMSIPLSSPAEYVGGELQFMASGIGVGGVPGSVLQPKGGVIAFPSFEMHRVTPVTKGRRYSLVIWVNGPAWC